MRRLVFVPIVLLTLLAFAAACGGGDSATGTPTRTPTPTATKHGSPTPAGSFTPGPTPAASPTATTPISTDQPAFVTPTPTPTPPPPPDPNEQLYIALGDSLSYGNGASDRNVTAWVPLVKNGLGTGWTLSDLGVPGYTSGDLLQRGEMDQAVAEINDRKTDGISGNEVGAITLEIGGNDLLNLYTSIVLPGPCNATVEEDLKIQLCVDSLRNALDGFTPNLEQAIDTLQQNAPGVPIFLATLYNPFSGAGNNIDAIGALALEGQDGTEFPQGLNDSIRTVAQEKGVHLVDWYPLFVGKVNEYISHDLIHPNDTGQQVMAQAMLQAMANAGLP